MKLCNTICWEYKMISQYLIVIDSLFGMKHNQIAQTSTSQHPPYYHLTGGYELKNTFYQHQWIQRCHLNLPSHCTRYRSSAKQNKTQSNTEGQHPPNPSSLLVERKLLPASRRAWMATVIVKPGNCYIQNSPYQGRLRLKINKLEA